MANEQLSELIKPALKVENLGVPVGLVNDLLLRLLFNEGDVSVSRCAEVLGLHVQVVDDLLGRMKQEHQVEVKRAGGLGSLSFIYSLTEEGTKRARDAYARSQYIGRVPVSLDIYRKVILLQTERKVRVTPTQVQNALSHLILPDQFHRRIGPALNAGTSLFLYGPPGNGKTTIAEALAELLSGGQPIWLPEAITVGGQFIRIFDPLVHQLIPTDDIPMYTDDFDLSSGGRLKVDNRWQLFKRPAVMVGGELGMDSLDLRFEPLAKIYEAPLQLKANGGMFLIDDFGRQQVSPQDLLNRWIVPLESNIDFLRLQSGQTLEVPFKQFIVFSTNLDPMQLVDGAFLRRIQMKVEVGNPDEKLFYQVFTMMCQILKVPFDKKSFVYLLQKWYREPGRVMQSVHPRDILKTIIAICNYDGVPPKLTPQLIDDACISYFVDAAKTVDLTKTAARGS